MNNSNSIYWAQDEVESVIDHCINFMSRFKNDSVSQGGIHSMWMRNEISYYSSILTSSSWDTALSFEGEQGELVRMVIPRARKLLRQVLSLSTQNRLDFQAVSTTQDMESVTASRIAGSLASSLVESEQLQRKAESVLEQALTVGSGFIKTGWRTDRGMPYARDEDGMIHYDGDLEFSTLGVRDVFYDTSKPMWEDQDAVIVRCVHNRWNLIAQHPDLRDHILKLPPVTNEKSTFWWDVLRGQTDEDSVYVYEMYHRITPAMPEGRMTMFGDKKTPFYDGPNLYECIPVDIMQPEKIHNTGYGYPMFSDLLPAQEMLDHCYSAISTNQAATAVQMYAAPRGADISSNDIGGMNFLLYTAQNVPGGGKPEALQLTQTAGETFKFGDMLEAQMMKLSQLNNAMIGEPTPGVTAGTAIATLTNNALRFMDPYIKEYTFCLEGCMSKAIKFMAKFGTTERIVSIVGKNSKEQAKTFVGRELESVKRMRLKTQSPQLQTIGGRLDIAEKLLPTGILKSPQKIISLLEGAPLESLYTEELSSNDLIQQERDMMLEGKMPSVFLTQDHPAHIIGHAADLNDQMLLQNHQAVALYAQHIQEHLDLEKSMDPFLKAICRTGKAPEMAMGMPIPQQGGGAIEGLAQAEKMPGEEPSSDVAEPAQPQA